MKSSNPNYHEVVGAFEKYFNSHPQVKSLEELEYKRWLKSVGSNFDAEGNLFTDPFIPKEVQKLAQQKNIRTSANWVPLGPNKVDWEAPMGSSHTTQGVIRSIAQHPNHPDTVILGSISAGLWYSAENGANWQNVGENLLADKIKGIAFSTSNPDIVYAASNAGPIKSLDGGLTWDYTGLNNSGSYPGGYDPFAMIVHQESSDTAFFACSEGLWRTENGGAHWEKELSGHIWDVEYHPSNPQILYASVTSGNTTNFKKSTDGGKNWTSVSSGYSSINVKRLCIAVTQAAPEKVYTYAADNDAQKGIIYISNDAGESFTEIESPNMLLYETSGVGNGLGQATWDMDLAVSDIDPDYILAGGIFVWKSVNGGNNWQVIDPGHPQLSKHWYHWDCQGLAIFGNKSWLLNDGGAFLSTDKVVTTTNKSFGLQAQEIWGFDTGWKSDIMAIGLYHGPVQIKDDNIYQGWYAAQGADAGTVQINKGDDRYIYARPWDCKRITRSDNRMEAPKYANLGTELPFYIYPIEIANHSYYNTFYNIDQREFKKTTNNAANWRTMKEFPGILRRITTSYSNENVAFVIQSFKKVFKTMDGGINWEEITPSSTLTQNKNLSNITVDGKNENIIWLSAGGKQSSVKVLKSVDGGSTWEDYSNGLPSFAINSIVHQIGTNGGVYAATDAGVYYRNNTMDEWALFSDGLPMATRVYFMRINYAKQKLRIGTLRGIWEGDLFETSALIPRPIAQTKGVDIDGEIQFFDHSTAMDGATFLWTFEGGNPETSSEENPKVSYGTQGVFDVTLQITDSRGTVSKTFEKFIVVGDSIPPAAPNNLTAKNITGTTLTLTWDHASDNVEVAGYYLYINNMKLGTIQATSFDLTNLQSGTTYDFHIVAFDSMDNHSEASNTVSVTMGQGSLTDPIGQQLWTLHAASSQETSGEDGAAVNAFDGDISTIWHTEWSQSTPNHPHMLDINLNNRYTLTELSYTPRQNGENGRIKAYEIYVSEDGTNWGEAVASGSWANNDQTQTAKINKVVGQYVRLKAISEVNGGAWATVAEINLRGGMYSSVVESSPTDFSCKLYPNPSKEGYFVLETKNLHNNAVANIYSLEGKLIKTIGLGTERVNTILTNDMQKGAYIIQIQSAEKQYTTKLFVD
jgi:chitodextrinase